jgi:Ca2+-transporting ATPase
MLTGDHATTAAAIARQVGISRKGVARATTGLEVEKMSQEEIVRRAKETGVFARVSPGHKLRILEAFKSQKYVVAMTGDGVNDAPALKGADIGVAMGRAGTEVAKEAADMVLMDDNFATIVHGVEQGRIIFSNLRRAVVFLVTTNLGEILTLAATLLIGLPLPVSAVMILWINLVTDGFCTIPLGIEPGHAGVLKQAPRPVSVGILNRASVRRVVMLAPVMAAGTLALFVYELDAGSYPHAQTMAFVTLSAFQWFQAFNARTSSQSLFSVGVLTNRPLLLSIGIAVLLQVGAVHTGVGRAAFGTVPLSGFDWFLCVIAASSILLIDEAFKALKVYERK